MDRNQICRYVYMLFFTFKWLRCCVMKSRLFTLVNQKTHDLTRSLQLLDDYFMVTHIFKNIEIGHSEGS